MTTRVSAAIVQSIKDVEDRILKELTDNIRSAVGGLSGFLDCTDMDDAMSEVYVAAKVFVTQYEAMKREAE